MTATEPKYKEVHIVDDNDVDTYISQHLLEEIGFASKISISTNGAEALEYKKNRPAIFMLTSSSDPFDVDKAVAFPMVKKYFSKPLSPEIIVGILEKD